MAAISKDDCEDDYIVCVIDKAAKHLGYDKIKDCQWPTQVLSTYEVHMFTNFN